METETLCRMTHATKAAELYALRTYNTNAHTQHA